MKKTGKKKTVKRAWRVVCVMGSGRVHGNCGHAHRTKLDAVRCGYAPPAYRRDQSAELRVVPARATARSRVSRSTARLMTSALVVVLIATAVSRGCKSSSERASAGTGSSSAEPPASSSCRTIAEHLASLAIANIEKPGLHFINPEAAP